MERINPGEMVCSFEPLSEQGSEVMYFPVDFSFGNHKKEVVANIMNFQLS